MKNYFLVIVSSLLFITGCASPSKDIHKHSEEVVVYNQKISKLNPRIDVEVQLSKENRPYALVNISDRNRANKCRSRVKGIKGSRNCFKETFRKVIKGLSVNSRDQLVYKNGKTEVECGKVSKSFLGNRIKFNEKCHLRAQLLSKKVDNGIDIQNETYGFVTFDVDK